MFAHGEHLLGGLTFWLLAIGSSVICLLTGGILHLFGSDNKKQIRVVAIVWFVSVLLSMLTAIIVDHSFNQ